MELFLLFGIQMKNFVSNPSRNTLTIDFGQPVGITNNAEYDRCYDHRVLDPSWIIQEA